MERQVLTDQVFHPVHSPRGFSPFIPAAKNLVETADFFPFAGDVRLIGLVEGIIAGNGLRRVNGGLTSPAGKKKKKKEKGKIDRRGLQEYPEFQLTLLPLRFKSS